MRTACAVSGAAAFFPRTSRAADAAAAVEQAHAELWRRFIDAHGVMLDFTDLDGSVNYPTPEECRAGKPNALGWWAPIENGAMVNGLYMDAAVNRWRHTKSAADAAKARKLMAGLLFLNSVSDVKGFVARGVSTDGRSHYAMGSNDQTMPWYFGLWRYLDSGLATKAERARITAKLVETTHAIISLGWKMPAEPPFGTRGSFAGFTFDTAPRQLFVLKLLHAVTGDAKWDALYRDALQQRGGKEDRSRREICEHGMVFEYAKTHNWTSCTAVAAIRGLWEMEAEPLLKAAFATGLKASAALAAESLPLSEKFNHHDGTTFSQDWRTPMLPHWKPQATEQEAQDLAHVQLREFLKLSPRRGQETAFIREPTAAAWIITLCPDAATVKQHAPAIERVIAHYDYAKLYYSTFFWVESAWWRLADAR
ncbi:MAG: hypothetical protein HY301_02955 [Verrucomicrobia bacterium]|nr:hypothetical protein [Verrucomicrobiota bacterium]